MAALSTAIYLAIIALGIVDALVGVPHVSPVTASLIIAFLAIEVRNAPRPQAAVGLGLIGAGCLSVYVSGADPAMLIDGFARAKTFLMLFFAVTWLRMPASDSPSIRAARRMIINQPPGRRYLYLATGVHVLGSVLNLAGLSLLSTMVERQRDPILRRRMLTALMIGFVSASSWSPFYVAMVVVLLAVPSLEWLDVAGWGIGLAVLAIAIGWMYDRFEWRHARGNSDPVVPVPLPARERLQVATILVSLIVLVIGFVEWAGVSIPVALALIAPPYAIIWYAMNPQHGDDAGARAGQIVSQVLGAIPGLRNEAFIFVGATVFGVGVSSLIPSADLTQWLDTYVPYVDLRLALLVYSILAIGAFGLHAVIAVILVGEVLPPEVMGVDDWVLGVSLLGIWGLSTLVNPYSGTTLYLARATGLSAFTIAWRWHPPVTLLLTTLTLLAIIGIRHLALL
ncbi:MAG: hypothetical protein HQ483_11895 [Rhodospirillales bacterium]|nr:hypothetical protein [Rhodospirillales bacterium]